MEVCHTTNSNCSYYHIMGWIQAIRIRRLCFSILCNLKHSNYISKFNKIELIIKFKANLIGWIITGTVLIGMSSWFIYCFIDVFFINKRPVKTLFQPEEEWGPLRIANKQKCYHLPNLEKYHDSKQRKKVIFKNFISNELLIFSAFKPQLLKFSHI